MQVAVGRRPKLSVFGNDWETPDKTCVRDYIHVMDLAAGHVRAVDLILRNGGLSGVKAYNLATGKGIVSFYRLLLVFFVASYISLRCILSQIEWSIHGRMHLLVARWR